MKVFVVFVLFFQVLFLGNPQAIAQVKPVEIQQIDKLMKQNPKPIIILLSAQWCSYCSIQKKQITEYLLNAEKANKYYWVFFDVESTEDIYFRQHLFKNKEANKTKKGYHQLARALNGEGQMQLPAWVILNEKYEIVFRYNGLLQLHEQEKILEKL